MKIQQSLFTEIFIFILILILLVLPPVFNAAANYTEVISISWTFPIDKLFLGTIAFLIYFYTRKEKNEKTNILRLSILPTTCALFATLFFLNFLSFIIPGLEKSEQAVQFTLPSSFITWVYCILNFSLSAFYEEVLYRYYLTDSMISITTKISPIFSKRVFKIIFEIIGCLLFAFAHLYLGILAVINAFIAHFILRIAYKKSNSVLPGFIAHFIYNVTSLFLM